MNAAVVVDTDIVSYIFKDDTRAERYRPLLEGKFLITHLTQQVGRS